MAKNYFNISTVKPYIIPAVVAIAGIVLIKKLVDRNKAKILGNSNVVDVVSSAGSQRIIEKNTTKTDAQLKSLANKIKNAWGILNDDEEAIYNAFRQINNYADLMQLFYYYGDRGIRNRGLEEDIQRKMNNKEISKINTILKQKGINYIF